MSRGGYTSAIDMWSLGCIMGELLQRVVRVGSANTPHLQVAPLFAIHGLPKTPQHWVSTISAGRPRACTHKRPRGIHHPGPARRILPQGQHPDVLAQPSSAAARCCWLLQGA